MGGGNLWDICSSREMYACEDQGSQWVSSSAMLLFVLKQDYSLNVELAVLATLAGKPVPELFLSPDVARLAGQWAPGMYLSPSPSLALWQHMVTDLHRLACLAFHMAAGDPNSELLTFVRQVL